MGITNKKKNGNIGQSNGEKGYVVKTYSVTPSALEMLETKYDELRAYAIEQGIRPMGKGDIVSKLFTMLPKLKPEEFFPKGK